MGIKVGILSSRTFVFLTLFLLGQPFILGSSMADPPEAPEAPQCTTGIEPGIIVVEHLVVGVGVSQNCQGSGGAIEIAATEWDRAYSSWEYECEAACKYEGDESTTYTAAANPNFTYDPSETTCTDIEFAWVHSKYKNVRCCCLLDP